MGASLIARQGSAMTQEPVAQAVIMSSSQANAGYFFLPYIRRYASNRQMVVDSPCLCLVPSDQNASHHCINEIL